MNARHHIADLHLDLSFESDDPRPQPVAEAALLALAHEHLLPVLEQVLEQEDDGRWRHIGRLDIDLGACAAHDYAHEIPPLLARLLREALARHDGEVGRPVASSDASAVATQYALPRQQVHFDIPAALDRPPALERFLRSGCLPALPALSGKNAIDGALRMSGQLLAPWLAAPDGTELAALLERCAADDDAAIAIIRRLAQQFEPHTLRQLVQQLETPARAAAWLAMVDAIEAALAPADGMQRQHLRQLWELVLHDILDSAAAAGAGAAPGLGARSMAPFAVAAPLRQAAASVAAGPDQVLPHTAALLRAIAAVPQVAPPQLHGQLQGQLQGDLQEQMQPVDRPDALAEMQAAATGITLGAIQAPALVLSASMTQMIEARIEASFATANAAPIYADWDLLLRDHADLLRAALLRHGGCEQLLNSFPVSLLENLAALASAEVADHAATPSTGYQAVYPAASAAATLPEHAYVQQRWQLCLMHLASQTFDVERLRSVLQKTQQVQQLAAPALHIDEGGLSSTSAGADGPTNAYWRVEPDWEDIKRHIAALPGAERMREAVCAAADASADRQAFLQHVATALREQQPLDLEQIEENIAVEQALGDALRSADQARIDAALAGASELASPAAGHSTQTLHSAQQVAAPALPVDEVRYLSSASAGADGPTNTYGQVGLAAALAQPPRLTDTADTTATDIFTTKVSETPTPLVPAIADQATGWDDVAVHIAALPGAGLMREAVRAAADASTDRQAFLQQVAIALREQQPLDLEQIEENISVEQALADALRSADTARIEATLAGASERDVLAAMHRIGDDAEVWSRLAHQQPALLKRLTMLAAPATPQVMQMLQLALNASKRTTATDIVKTDIVTADIVTTEWSAAPVPLTPAIDDAATAWEDVERHITALPGTGLMREAVRAAADASADRQAFLQQVATALREQQPLDLEQIEESIAVEQALADALRSADPAGIDAALAGASERDVLAAMHRIGDNAEVWSQLARLDPALLMRLTNLASPATGQLMQTLQSAQHVAAPALPVDAVGDLGSASAAADGPTNAYGQVKQVAALVKPHLLTDAADTTATDIATTKLAETPAQLMPAIADQATDWDDVEMYIATLPGTGLMREAVRAAADASADRQAFLQQVAIALREQQPLDLEQIEENIAVEQSLADALRSADPARIDAALSGASERDVLAAMHRIGDNAEVWSQLARLHPALLMRLTTLASPATAQLQTLQSAQQVAAPALPVDAVGDLSSASAGADGRTNTYGQVAHATALALAQPLLLTDAADTTATEIATTKLAEMPAQLMLAIADQAIDWDDAEMYIAALPGAGLMREAVRAAASASADRQAFLQQVATALREQQPLDLEQIEENIAVEQALADALRSADPVGIDATLASASERDVLAAMHRIGDSAEVWSQLARLNPALLMRLTTLASADVGQVMQTLQSALDASPLPPLPPLPPPSSEPGLVPSATEFSEAPAPLRPGTGDFAITSDQHRWQRCLTSLAVGHVNAAALLASFQPLQGQSLALALALPPETQEPAALPTPAALQSQALPEGATVLYQALAAADATRVRAALADAPRHTVLEAMRRIGASGEAWARIARLHPALLMRLTAQASPEAARIMLASPLTDRQALTAPLASAATPAPVLLPAAATGSAGNTSTSSTSTTTAAAATHDQDAAIIWQRSLSYLATTIFEESTFRELLQTAALAAGHVVADAAAPRQDAATASLVTSTTTTTTTTAPPATTTTTTTTTTTAVSMPLDAQPPGANNPIAPATSAQAGHLPVRRRVPGGELERALSRHAPAQRAALGALLHEADDEISQLAPATVAAMVTLLAGIDRPAQLRHRRDVGDLALRHVPALTSAMLEVHSDSFDLHWFFIERRNFSPPTYAHALAAWLSLQASAPATPLHHAIQERLGLAQPQLQPQPHSRPPTTHPSSALIARSANELTLSPTFSEDEGDTLLVNNAGLVLIGPYMPRLFSMLGLTDSGRFRDMQAAERAVHLLQCVLGGPPDTPEALLGLNKILCGVPSGFAIAREVAITEQERDTIDMMLRAIIEHWKTIGNTSPDGLRQSFLQRGGRMHIKDDAWQLQVAPGTFDMLLDSIPWSFSIIKHPWMERAVHVNWR